MRKNFFIKKSRILNEGDIEMKMIKHLIPLSILCFFVFAKQSDYKVNQDITIQTVNEQRPVVIENSNVIVPQSREEIDLWVEDFENGQGDWFFSPGWNITNSDSNSPSNSANSPNDASTIDGTHDMITPVISLPALGDGETMNFSFYLKADMPDADGDGDNGLEDYYSVSIQDTEALAWQPSPTGSYDGNSYWCGDEEVGGYLDSWIQFLDTPSFIVPAGATMTADLMWAIEDPAGAVIAGSCTDGWDAANVQISVDGGVTWNLLNGSDPYDFQCGYGWIWNSNEYDTGGSLNNLAAGWGGDSGGWNNVSFNLSQYAGQEAMIRFAFGSDPAYCTLDDATITGFHVDNIVVSGGALSCSPESNCETSVAGAVWVDQFYDYGDVDRPGYQQWEQYVVGMPFNGNVFMDISDFATKDVQFRIQSRYDDNNDGGTGTGLFIDDFRIYKNSGGSFPPPFDLVGEVGNESVSLSWSDLNASGTDDFIYDNDDGTGSAFTNGITVTGESAWAGERLDLAGESTINSISIFNNNLTDTTITVGAFGQFGSLFNNEASYTTTIEAVSGQWTTVDVAWDMTNAFIVAHEFNGSFAAAAFSGVVKSTCTYPLDLIKTTIQLQKKANIQHQRQGTIFNTGADIIRRKGVTALYVGWTTSLIQQVGKVGIQFSAFEFWYSFLQSAFTQYNNSFENIENKHSILTFSAGLFAGATEAIIWTTPTERLKIIQQAELREGVKTREHRGFVRALTNIIKTHGVSNLFVGVVPTAIRQGSSLGIRFLLFSTLKLISLFNISSPLFIPSYEEMSINSIDKSNSISLTRSAKKINEPFSTHKIVNSFLSLYFFVIDSPRILTLSFIFFSSIYSFINLSFHK